MSGSYTQNTGIICHIDPNMVHEDIQADLETSLARVKMKNKKRILEVISNHPGINFEDLWLKGLDHLAWNTVRNYLTELMKDDLVVNKAGHTKSAYYLGGSSD